MFTDGYQLKLEPSELEVVPLGKEKWGWGERREAQGHSVFVLKTLVGL